MKYLRNVFVILLAGVLGLLVCVAQAEEQQVQLTTHSGVLAGSLLLPDKPCPCAVAMIIAGSGATDRDGNNVVGLHTDGYKQLAQALAQAGIASLRFDKRGVGGSAAANPGEAKLRFETYVDDAVAWRDWLHRDARFNAIAVLGHSEGALIGSLVAKDASVRAFVSLSGVGEPIGKVLLRQLADKLTPEQAARHAQIVAALEAGHTVDEVPSSLGSMYRASIQPYLISWMRYDPTVVMASLKLPVLIVQGEADFQVLVDDARKLVAAKPGAQLLLVPGMTHTLKQISDGVTQTDTYRRADVPLSAPMLAGVLPFLKANLQP